MLYVASTYGMSFYFTICHLWSLKSKVCLYYRESRPYVDDSDGNEDSTFFVVVSWLSEPAA